MAGLNNLANWEKLSAFYHGFDENGTNQLMVTVSTAVGLLSSVVKLLLGIFLSSSIWLFSGLYSFVLAGARFLFLRSIYVKADQHKAKRTTKQIAICLIAAGIGFDLCAMFRQFDMNIGQHFPLILVIPASLMILLSYLLSLLGIFRTRKNRSLSFYTYRVISISGSLMNMVLLQRMILSQTKLSVEWIISINSVFSYFIGGTLIITALILLVRAIHDKD